MAQNYDLTLKQTQEHIKESWTVKNILLCASIFFTAQFDDGLLPVFLCHSGIRTL